MPLQRFPSTADYDKAVSCPEILILDPVIQKGQARFFEDSPLVYSGGFARVYHFDVDQRQYAFRCWIKDSGRIEKVYKTISECKALKGTTYFAEPFYLAEGVMAGIANNCYPTLRMEWIEAPSLREFLRKNRQEPDKLYLLRREFSDLCKYMDSHSISHGDLQPDNIKVRHRKDSNGKDHLEIVLIDYDSMVVPGLENEPATVAGLPGFQHPKRINGQQLERTSRTADYFSQLVIYISILALERYPHFWVACNRKQPSPNDQEKFDIENRDRELLFTPQDIADPKSSRCFRTLQEKDDPELKRLTSILIDYCAESDLTRLQPLQTVLGSVGTVFDGPIPKSKGAFLRRLRDEAEKISRPEIPETVADDNDQPPQPSPFVQGLRQSQQPGNVRFLQPLDLVKLGVLWAVIFCLLRWEESGLPFSPRMFHALKATLILLAVIFIGRFARWLGRKRAP